MVLRLCAGHGLERCWQDLAGGLIVTLPADKEFRRLQETTPNLHSLSLFLATLSPEKL